VAKRPLWLNLIIGLATISLDRNCFDCASAQTLKQQTEQWRLRMAIAGTFLILSVGILMAHAMDAFRSRL
jgi:hypothetical protein